MERKDRIPEAVLDEALASIRAEHPSREVEDAAVERLRRRLQGQPAKVENINSLKDFKALIPEYLGGTLSEARRLLFEDEMRNSVALRRAVQDARGLTRRVKQPRTSAGNPWARWAALAAMLLVAIGLARWGFFDGLLPRAVGQANVRSVRGDLFRVNAAGNRNLVAGQPIHFKEEVKTAKDAGAELDLADGSVMELRERSEFSFSRADDGLTVNLHRGSVIIQAAKRRKGHLYVRTNDCMISVTGTVFSVSSGAKGSRVAVLEGEVVVEQGRQRHVLKPGMQFTSGRRLTPVPLEEEIAWSSKASQYRNLLVELKGLDRDLNQALFPGLRFRSRFLDLVPSNTAVYIALPNLGTGLSEASDIFLRQVESKPTLARLWNDALAEIPSGHSPFEIVESLRELGSHLGDEIVIAVSKDGDGQLNVPLILAKVQNAQGLRDLLKDQLTQSAHGVGELILLDDPAGAESRGRNLLYVYLKDDLLAASPFLDALQRFQSDEATGRSKFAGSAFHRQLDALYRQGVDWLFGVDVHSVLAEGLQDAGDRRIAAAMGVDGIQHFVAELRNNDGRVENRAMLTFDGPRQGVMSWLASPASIGALELVSHQAEFAAAFAVRDPGVLLDEFIAMVGERERGQILQGIAEAERELGLDLRSDIAGTLGGEFVVALDGPLFPIPAFKLVLEVYDADRLQAALESAVERINTELTVHGRPEIRLERDGGAGAYYRLSTPALPMVQISYAFIDGYLVATPARSLIEDAVKYRDAGLTLPRSEQFQALLPLDGHTGFSGVVYQKLGSSLRSLLDMVGRHLPREQSEMMRAQMEAYSGSLLCAYAEEDRIVFATTGDMSFSPGSLMSGLGAGMLMGLEK